MNNLSSYYGLTDSRMSASEKDLPVIETWQIEIKSFLSNLFVPSLKVKPPQIVHILDSSR